MCGVAQDYCIAAPGGRVTAAYPTSIQILEYTISNTDDYNDTITVLQTIHVSQ